MQRVQKPWQKPPGPAPGRNGVIEKKAAGALLANFSLYGFTKVRAVERGHLRFGHSISKLIICHFMQASWPRILPSTPFRV